MKTSGYLDNANIIARQRITQYQVECDGRTVWLNTPSFCLARFRQTGMDIYAPPFETNSELLCYASWEGASRDHWTAFKSNITEFFGIDITDDYMPHVQKAK